MMKKMESSKTYTEDLYFILKDSNIDFNFLEIVLYLSRVQQDLLDQP